MFQTKVTEMSTLAGLAPAGKPSNAHQAQRRVVAVTLRVSTSWLACALAAIGTGPAQAQTATETVVHSFAASPPTGGYPRTGLIRDSAGNLYGTTSGGGIANAGVVYKLNTAGQQTILHNFTGGDDGGYPGSGVVADKAGNLYGTTVNGGTAGRGVVFKLDRARHETVLYNFTGGADGGSPYGGLLIDPVCKSPCVLYGTTQSGGTSNAGVVYKLDTTGAETVLYPFTGGADGGGPYSGVINDSAGNLYGTTYAGGTSGQGVVYKLDPAGTETVLYTFTGLTDGGQPYAGVIRDSAGNLYGTTVNGTQPTGYIYCGVVYKLDPSGNQTVLHTFGDTNLDGWYPQSGVIRDAAGNLYGTTEYGGATASAGDNGGAGTVFKLDSAGNETLYSFSFGASGYYPAAGVIEDGAGNFYGTTSSGGPLGFGAVYEFDAAGTETVLYGFQSPVDGSSPYAGAVGDSAGNLYGTTEFGGTSGQGVVYRVSGSGKETVLYTFTGGADGGNPMAGVILDSAGNLYGTTSVGGSGYGVVFKLDPGGQETVLYTFTGGTDGGYPYAGLISDSAGNLYGTTYCGGSGQGCAGYGVVFELNAAGQETALYTFTGGADGGNPQAGLLRDSAGNLYGTASGFNTLGWGVVFELNTAGQETVLYTFTNGADGGTPEAGLIRDSAGNLYGTASSGGASNAGVVFSVNTAGQETVLYTFTGGADGGYPYAGVIRDSAGNLYGTAPSGGSGHGVVYKVNTAGQETVLYTFTGGTDGGNPQAGLIHAPAGKLIGTASSGGKEGYGVVFELKVR